MSSRTSPLSPLARKGRRNDRGQFAKRHSTIFVITSWTASIISLVVLWFSSRAISSDIGAFRHCATDGNNLYIHNCGKTTVNVGDFVLLGLFAASAFLSFSLLTGLWRMSRFNTKRTAS